MRYILNQYYSVNGTLEGENDKCSRMFICTIYCQLFVYSVNCPLEGENECKSIWKA